MQNYSLNEKTLSLSERLSVRLDDWTLELRIVSNDDVYQLKTLQALHGRTIQVILTPPVPPVEVIDVQRDFAKREQEFLTRPDALTGQTTSGQLARS